MRRITRSSIGAIGAILLVLTLLASMLAMASRTSAASPRQEKTERNYFSARVLAGPDTGLALSGTMKMDMQSAGVFTGTLIRKSGPVLQIQGQVTGNNFNVAIMLAGHKVIFGTGTLLGDLTRGNGAAGGTFTGPSDADLGGWTLCMSAHARDGTCYGLHID